MSVLFELDGWQIVKPYTNTAHVMHGLTCQSYEYHYMNINGSYNVFKCGVCGTIVPSNIQCLVILHNWED